jgi:DNA-binding PadR family transcriptional regulator
MNIHAKEIRERIFRNFMDLIILKELKNGLPMSGYDIIALFHKKFHILPSAGSVYSVLYSMERKGLVKGIKVNGKRVYKLTNNGEKKLRDILRDVDSIYLLIKSIFLNNGS